MGVVMGPSLRSYVCCLFFLVNVLFLTVIESTESVVLVYFLSPLLSCYVASIFLLISRSVFCDFDMVGGLQGTQSGAF